MREINPGPTCRVWLVLKLSLRMRLDSALNHHKAPPLEMPDASLQQIEFEHQFRGHTRDDFQSWFAGVVKLLHPGGDLQRVRVTRGDGGLDCVSINRGRVYQCYAPARIDEMRDAETAGKIRGDFAEAVATIGEALREWVFVHNHPESQLGHLSATALVEIKAAHPSITILVWGRMEFWAELSRLPKLALAQTFGNDSTQVEVVAVNLDDLQRVIARLETSPFPLEPRPPEMPDLRKLEFNDLTGAVQASLHTGRMLDKKVERLFSGNPTDIERGERVAEGFRRHYGALRDSGTEPNRIFDLLLEYAGWAAQETARGNTAVLGVLSYFFHRCDIFENPAP